MVGLGSRLQQVMYASVYIAYENLLFVLIFQSRAHKRKTAEQLKELTRDPKLNSSICYMALCLVLL